MDPISITTGVFSFLAASIKTGLIIKDFYDNVAFADTKVQGLLTEAESFTQVLRMMNDTLEQENIQSSLNATGHIGNHLKNLATSIEDGQKTLSQLQETLEKVNKSVSLLDGTRKHLRLKGATDEIAVYQGKIRSYRETIQLTLQAIILHNQVEFQDSTQRVLPNMYEIQLEIRRVALDINGRIAGLQNAIDSRTSDFDLTSLQNLRNCVKSTASIVSSASSTLSVDHSDRMSVAYQSDFGDCFPPEPEETMRRWISSNTVYEFEEEMGTASSISGPNDPFGKGLELAESGRESDQSDSDGELEAEIIQSLLRRGKDKLASQEYEAAERHFRNCLSRVPSNGSTASLHRLLGSKSEIMALLLTTYRLQEKWDEAHSLLTEKIALESRNSSKNSHGVLADTLVLVEVLFKKSAFAEALLYGRRALKSYRRMGPDGTEGVQSSLRLLCQVCKASGNHDQEDAYNAILSDILQQHPPVAEATTSSTERNDPGLRNSSKPPRPDKPLSLKSPSVKSARSQDTMRSNSSWISSSPSNSTSLSDRTYRRDSLLSAKSLGPSSPNTEYSFSSSKSQEGFSGAEDLFPRRLDSSTLSSPVDNPAAASDVSRETKFDASSRIRYPTQEKPFAPYDKELFHKDKGIVPSDSTDWTPMVAETEQVADVRTRSHDASRNLTYVDMHRDDAVSADQPLVGESSSPPLSPNHELREHNDHDDQAAENDPKPTQMQAGIVPDLGTNSGLIKDTDTIHSSPLLQQRQIVIAQEMQTASAKPTNYQAPSVEDQNDESGNTQQAEKTPESLPSEQLTASILSPRETLPPPKGINHSNDLDSDRQKPADRSLSRKLTKRQSPEFKFCDPRAHHVHSGHLECAAVEYFRAGKGNPPKPVEPVCPEPRVPIPVSDYELLEWIGTLSDAPSIARPDAGMDGLMVTSLEVPLQKKLWKSKSAADLFDSGVVELPGEIPERRKSTEDLHSSTRIAISQPKPAETIPAANDEIDWNAWYAPKPPKEDIPVVDGGIDWTAWYCSSNYVNGVVKETGSRTIPALLPTQPQAKAVPPIDLVGLTAIGPVKEAMLNTLVEMGYSRVLALSALEGCNWNIERAANDLASEMVEEPDSLANSGTPQVYVSGADGNSNISPTEPFARPVSFQALVQLQSSALSAHMHRPSLSSLTGDHSESSLTTGTKSHKKSVSFDSAFSNNHGPNPPLQASHENQPDELLDLAEASRQLQYRRPKNPLGASLGFQFPAGNVANDLTAHQSPTRREEEIIPRQVTLELEASRPSPASPGIPSITFSDVLDGHAAIRRKVVICGDCYCGKSSLVSMFSKGVFPEEYHSAEFEVACVQQKAGDRNVELVLWDTGGDLNYSSFREKGCYSGSHLVMICFAIDSPDSLDNAQELFVTEMKNSLSSVRCMLVGLKKDLRYDPETTQRLLSVGQHAVTPGEGEVTALKMGANIYMECSAKTGEGVKEIFETAASLAMLPNEKLKKMRSLRKMFGKK